MLLNIILATVIVSLISLLGILLLFKKNIPLKPLISLAAGVLLSVAFLDLLPEALEGGIYDTHLIFSLVLISIIFFFLVERVFHWHHCHCGENDVRCVESKKNIAILNIVGDGIHNFIDGALIASAFMFDFSTGLIVTLAVIFHEIPQEISDFGILLYSGMSKIKAVLYNLITAFIAVVGALLFYYFGTSFENIIPLMLAIAAGNFIYLATADLIPELHHENKPKKIISHSIWLIIGVLLMYYISQVVHH